ncbi:hypothetical protein Dda_3044 [Drechslerella dactyloides]|uniref:Uncharacterized protein n=1 Tax=Drechslerella dactyloides TaxID=74499 RepID=A0AAD6NKW2_DREDA|nr:hypothetical protein Dda_3044 [Drechslerella dactyloides]
MTLPPSRPAAQQKETPAKMQPDGAPTSSTETTIASGPVKHKSPAMTLSRKRSAAILQASPSPPSSRPPSQGGGDPADHKRSRVARQWTACPEHVSPAETSIRLDQRAEEAIVAVMQPGSDGLSGEGQFSELVSQDSRFTMLCFLGCIADHLHAVSVISSLLATFKVNVYGVSLMPPPPRISSLPIIYDGTRQLTTSLGLMHPLGGGRQALDAIVVLDSKLRRRMLLPVGWGVRKPQQPGLTSAYTNGEEELVLSSEQEVERAVKRLVDGVEWLAHEATEEYAQRWNEGVQTTRIHGIDH